MIEKGIRAEICNAVHRSAKATNKYMSDYDENTEPSYNNYWDVNKLYRWVCLRHSQKLPTYNFE